MMVECSKKDRTKIDYCFGVSLCDGLFYFILFILFYLFSPVPACIAEMWKDDAECDSCV